MLNQRERDIRLLETTKLEVENVGKVSTHTLHDPKNSEPYAFIKHGLWVWLRGTEGYYKHDSRLRNSDSSFKFDIYHKGRLSRKYIEHLSMEINKDTMTVSRRDLRNNTTATVSMPEDMIGLPSLDKTQRYALRRARKFARSISTIQLKDDASRYIIAAANAKQ